MLEGRIPHVRVVPRDPPSSRVIMMSTRRVIKASLFQTEADAHEALEVTFEVKVGLISQQSAILFYHATVIIYMYICIHILIEIKFSLRILFLYTCTPCRAKEREHTNNNGQIIKFFLITWRLFLR